MRVNGRLISRPSVSAIDPMGVPDFAEAAADKARVVITVGREVKHRTKRRVKLLPLTSE